MAVQQKKKRKRAESLENTLRVAKTATKKVVKPNSKKRTPRRSTGDSDEEEEGTEADVAPEAGSRGASGLIDTDADNENEAPEESLRCVKEKLEEANCPPRDLEGTWMRCDPVSRKHKESIQHEIHRAKATEGMHRDLKERRTVASSLIIKATTNHWFSTQACRAQRRMLRELPASKATPKLEYPKLLYVG